MILVLLTTFVPPPPTLFVDRAGERGLVFTHETGVERVHDLVEATGSGACAFDADGDGDDDVLLVSGGVLDGTRPRAPNRLFLNDGGRFRDAGSDAGVAGPPDAWGMGCAAADVEGDGDVDLLVTAFGPDQLLLNDGTGRFRDVAERAGVRDPRWTTSAAFADHDLDGDLDLAVGGYVHLVPRQGWCRGPGGLELLCRPFDYDAVPSRLLRNDGVGADGVPRFTDVSGAAGVVGEVGKTLGVLFEDLTEDGLPDLYFANDTVRSTLLVNVGGTRFEDRTLAAGVGLSAQGLPQASMGLDAGDLDGDGLLELHVTNFQGETNTLWRGVAPGRWEDVTDSSGMGAASLALLGFGVHFADFDLDGRLDVFVANGHVDDRVHLYDAAATWAQRDQVFLNASRPGVVRLVELRPGSGPPPIDAPLRAGRGSAILDVDADGDLDVVVSESAAPATLLENVSPRAGRRWLEVSLEAPAPNTQALGARVFAITPDGRVQHRRIRTAVSYLSSSPPRAWFGLGREGEATVVVRWPDGRVSWTRLRADGRHRVLHPALAAGSPR